jgi:hypothetical protein
VRDPVAAHDRGRVLQPQRLGQLAVAKNGRPDPKTTGTWLTTTWSINPSLSAWPPI